MKLEELVEDWRETVEDYDREYSEGMEHERGYSFAKRMFLELNEAVILVPRMIKALKAADYLAQKANPVTAPHRHMTGIASRSALDALSNAQIAYEEALAELEQP